MNEYKTLSYSELLAHKDEECCICQDLIYHDKSKKDSRACETTCCKRLLHIACIEKWVFDNSTCPLCRAPCTSPLIKYYHDVKLPGGYMAPDARKVWFKSIIDEVIPGYFDLLEEPQTNVSGTFTVSKIKLAISEASWNYLEWRKNRGLNYFWHCTKKGANRVENLNHIVSTWSGIDPKELFSLICKEIRDYPRKDHSYTSFILNSFSKMKPISLYLNDYDDYTAGTLEVRDKREYLLTRGLEDILGAMCINSRFYKKEMFKGKLHAKVFGKKTNLKIFWNKCFSTYLDNTKQVSFAKSDLFVTTNPDLADLTHTGIQPESPEVDFIIIVTDGYEDYVAWNKALSHNNIPIVRVVIK
ncbi:hypothetical protein EDC55_10636 [Allofrancisella inopinata]|uniref:RING-type domain-containing protein n=1 Tax=Allofrancisella inopinata TaxID=1085647 RepID=A0AAE6YJ90_9GAMM|nr:hypothetical protein [Allofrancisella inopinata]QIV95784.1 hypothetical protein E4K63_02620 [Allofrancisella inopinata]TDT72822.1 hypothetical protein EDC55_10636 [Allofrancisella inopinata]